MLTSAASKRKLFRDADFRDGKPKPWRQGPSRRCLLRLMLPNTRLRLVRMLEKLRESWGVNHKLLASYEREQSKLRVDMIKRRKLYQDGAIAKTAVVEAEQALVAVLVRVQETRRSLIESDMALTEAALGDGLEGKALIKYLRGSGIPFIVFKTAVPGASTGPHIHIGKPSLRLASR